MTDTLITKLVAWIRRCRIVIGILISLVVFSYGYVWLMTPRVNPHPSKKVVMRGEFPFEKGWELRVEQSFYAKNSLCKRMARVFLVIPQAMVSREAWAPSIVPKRVGSNGYEMEYFQDYLVPGFCDWAERFAYYRIHSGGKEINGSALLGFPNLYNKITYSCFMQTLPVNTAAKYESGLVCLDGSVHKSDGRTVYKSNSSFDPSLRYGEVNFFWKEERP